ncbi:MAG: hypothetical protein ACU84J_15915 [Gammaproteobacteria bacterium]
MTQKHIANLLEKHPFSPVHVDCAVTVMLKILDGKCKMKSEEKVVMAQLYDHIKDLPGELLGPDIHRLITEARDRLDDEQMKNFIYEKRVLAETAISRPVMKNFKAMIRQQGLFAEETEETAV